MASADTPFRFMLYDLSKELSEENRSDLNFLYSVSNDDAKTPLDLFNLLIKQRRLSALNKVEIKHLVECLDKIGRPDLKTCVESYIINQTSDEPPLEAIQESGKPLNQEEITLKTVHKSCFRRPRKKQKPFPGDKGTVDISEEFDENTQVAECHSTTDCSDGDNDDQYFMEKALQVAQNSPDTDTKVGALVVSAASSSHPRKILGEGWNKMPKGCETKFCWTNKGEGLDQKYWYVLHGGMAAITDALMKHGNKVEGSTLYITLFPDNKDAQLIRQYGIQEVVYIENKYFRSNFAQASKRILEGLNCRQLRMMK